MGWPHSGGDPDRAAASSDGSHLLASLAITDQYSPRLRRKPASFLRIAGDGEHHLVHRLPDQLERHEREIATRRIAWCRVTRKLSEERYGTRIRRTVVDAIQLCGSTAVNELCIESKALDEYAVAPVDSELRMSCIELVVRGVGEYHAFLHRSLDDDVVLALARPDIEEVRVDGGDDTTRALVASGHRSEFFAARKSVVAFHSAK